MDEECAAEQELNNVKKLLGGLTLLMGVVLLLWIGYNLFIGMQPEAQGRNPIPAVFVSAGLIFVGAKWVRGK